MGYPIRCLCPAASGDCDYLHLAAIGTSPCDRGASDQQFLSRHLATAFILLAGHDLLFSFRFLFPSAFPRQVFERKHIVIGILAGLGSGLINVFIISVISNLPVNQSLALSSAVPPPLLKWASCCWQSALPPLPLKDFSAKFSCNPGKHASDL